MRLLLALVASRLQGELIFGPRSQGAAFWRQHHGTRLREAAVDVRTIQIMVPPSVTLKVISSVKS